VSAILLLFYWHWCGWIYNWMGTRPIQRVFIQKYDVRLFRIGFFQCLCAVQLGRVLRLKSRIEWTIKQKCHLIFMSSFQFTNRTFWILNVDKCWNNFSEKKNGKRRSFLRCVNKICSRLIQRNQIFSDGSIFWNFETFFQSNGISFKKSRKF
jgi:hypothetical protein